MWHGVWRLLDVGVNHVLLPNNLCIGIPLHSEWIWISVPLFAWCIGFKTRQLRHASSTDWLQKIYSSCWSEISIRWQPPNNYCILQRSVTTTTQITFMDVAFLYPKLMSLSYHSDHEKVLSTLMWYSHANNNWFCAIGLLQLWTRASKLQFNIWVAGIQSNPRALLAERLGS